MIPWFLHRLHSFQCFLGVHLILLFSTYYDVRSYLSYVWLQKTVKKIETFFSPTASSAVHRQSTNHCTQQGEDDNSHTSLRAHKNVSTVDVHTLSFPPHRISQEKGLLSIIVSASLLPRIQQYAADTRPTTTTSTCYKKASSHVQEMPTVVLAQPTVSQVQ